MTTASFSRPAGPAVAGPASGAGAAKRVVSVDVYRGLVMLLMMAEVLSFGSVAQQHPGNAFWRFMAFRQTHVLWVGCSLHDLIQPSFSFLVGVALPYSLASRLAKGQHFGHMLRHTLIRSLILVLLGIFLRSLNDEQTNFTFEDTLTQIGLGYTFLFLLAFCSRRVQVVSLVLILAGYWLAFALYPLPGPGFDYAAAGTAANWEYNLRGFAAHWNKNTNLAWAFDRWFLNLFPRSAPFLNNAGGYATLSFIPTLGTMVLGLFAGQLLRSQTPEKEKVKKLVITGAILIVVAIALHKAGISPIIKRIWTPGWTVFSGGICFLLLALFYGVIDVGGKMKWSFFLMIIGANSITAYVMADGGMRAFIERALYTHLGRHYDQLLGLSYSTLVKGTLVLLLEWLILYWMYRRKIFIRV